MSDTFSISLPEAGRSAPPMPGESISHLSIRAGDLPLAAIENPVALALIRATIGPAYRPAGAMMLIGRGGEVAGNLSSGCIDADIALHAAEVAASGLARDLRYGLGSPFADLALPCGGGLDIRVLPLAGFNGLAALRAALQQRQVVDLWISAAAISFAPFAGADMHLQILPDIRFLIYGKGPEALAFARMTAGAGYETFLGSPDPDLIAFAGAEVQPLPFPPARQGDVCLPADRHSAITLFFHDHEFEPAVLTAALASETFYIGAQGSRRTAERRRATMQAAGCSEADLARLRGPIGLIPSTRDARSLAVSVLAEILAESQKAH